MIERVSGRRAFARLRAEGEHRGRGPLRLVSRPDPTASHARIAFAIPRSVGSAVERNRVRRRIRAVIGELVDENPTLLAPGDHLIRITAPLAHWSHATLRHTMTELLTPDPTT